jgi:hypothetical protein
MVYRPGLICSNPLAKPVEASEEFQPANRLFIDLGGNLAYLWILDKFAVSGPDVGFGYLF